ncbi:candidapepsin-4 precursor [Akanthomyces lecanii RCEF 1005]|uniref:Candidapepsin-4 n=1 Tax=Akanthomyces lecanii RCEF 1005 TaxID=1081108 RepID=A0A168FS50_CORDF|nr:candidapepsin-4 precursor [Akanthomyces lecanii RCEF 1005]
MHDILALSALLGLASAGTVSVDIHKQINAELYDALKIHRRTGDPIVDLQAINNVTGGGYYADLGIGTPKQVLTFHLDTGSSDTWVNQKGNNFCRYGSPELQLPPSCLKQFDPDASSTFETTIRGGFKISYLDGSQSSGDYFNDTVTIGDMTITQQQLGLAKKSSSATGLMGLGMSVGVAAKKEYPTIIDNLVSQGYIDTAAFSLYLDSVTESHGTFLFGGVDTKKYIGDLATLPLVADDIHGSDNVTSYAVDLTGFSVDGVSLPSLKTKAILDTGATLVLLPGRVVTPIYTKLGVVSVTGIATPFIDCSGSTKKDGKDNLAKTKFNFEFNGKTISVPLKEMIVNSFDDHQDIFKSPLLKSQFKDFGKVCMFGIANADDYKTQEPDPLGSSGGSSNEPEYALLGDTFLRSAYVVYDLARQEVAIAQSYPKSNETNIVTLKANSTIPSIKGMDAPAEDTAASAAGLVRAPSTAAAAALAVVAAAVFAM